MKVLVPPHVVADTLKALQTDGASRREGVVLWLGRRRANEVRVAEAVRPDQEAGRDFFRIPPTAMTALQDRLREENLMIAAQIHSHPRAAFHSVADDTWAIVRHVGALSLVLPDFAQRSKLDTFWTDAVVFAMHADGRWVEVMVHDHIEVIP